jgi:uncharacterized membrane protein
MMRLALAVLTFLHIASIAAYAGGAFVMEFVLTPAQKAVPPAQARIVGEKTSGRYLLVAWSALGMLFVTCVTRLVLTHQLGLTPPFFRDRLNLGDPYGRTTLALFVVWLILVSNGSILTFKIRPKLVQKFDPGTGAQRVAATQKDQEKWANWASRIVRIDLGLAVVAIVLGVSLRFGGFV